MKFVLTTIYWILLVFSTPCFAQSKENVPLVRLLATPHAYNGVPITVSGVLHRSESGILGLYLDPSSAEYGITANAIAILLSDKSGGLSGEEIEAELGRYVLVAATFDIDPPQTRGYSGILKAVSALRAYPILRALE